MPSALTIAKTLALVASLETDNGRNLDHTVIKNPNSIHYGTSAQGIYGVMPKTIEDLKARDADEAARKLAAQILKHNGGCPVKAAVVQWEQGQNITVKPKHWQRGNAQQRHEKVLERFPKTKRTKAYGKRFI
jgi:hypothetical protein